MPTSADDLKALSVLNHYGGANGDKDTKNKPEHVEPTKKQIYPLNMDLGDVSEEPLRRRAGSDSFEDEGSIAAVPHHHTRRHELFKTIAGVAGNVLEWYDFAVFGFFGDIIADVFFPPQNGHAAIVESFAIFGGAFLMRPIGGVMLGYIGDMYGRKRALELSIFLMAGPTFCMGCLPSYEQVGWISPVLLTVVRLLQGLSVGGQLVSSLVFTLEGHPRSKWGLYGSYVMASANLGTLLGGIIGFVLRSLLNQAQLESWGWRIPFLSGILVSLSGIYLKYYCDSDDEIHAATPGEQPVNPIRQAFARENRRSLLASALVPMLWSAGFYLTFVWMAVFMNSLVDPPVPNAFAVNSSALFASVCLLFPIAGILSDKYGRKFIMTIGGLSMGLLSPFMVIIIGTTGSGVAAFFAQSILGIALSFWGAPMCAWLVEAFPPAARLTSVAIGYNLAQATIGGLTPSLATVMVDTVGVYSPGFVLTALATLSLIGLRCVAPPPPPLVNEELVATNGGNNNISVATSDGYALPPGDNEAEISRGDDVDFAQGQDEDNGDSSHGTEPNNETFDDHELT